MYAPLSTPDYLLSLTLAESKRWTGDDGLSVFNGAFGVDSQDILNIPEIDFGTFQVFPDSVNYGSKGTATNVQPPSSQFSKTLNDTVDWIGAQVQSARTWAFLLLTADAFDLRSDIL